MSRPQIFLLLLCCLPLAAALRCYTCVFPAISPLDCLKFPQECPAGQHCLASTAVGTRGALRVVLYEKSCAIPAQCGRSGEKETAGLHFNYTNECCDVDLCNAAARPAALGWTGAGLCLLPALHLLLL
ncbi:prostate stem cell antigen-like [Hypomesus transpacificus]|uniref:prostate stem cell antigen-like n=1 Tax=Hypomesus transpacificus TaxID=137520 RepID=UPI001F077F00|nr:prostate stem cell antigen-like [Hypomesus transpacificus]